MQYQFNLTGLLLDIFSGVYDIETGPVRFFSLFEPDLDADWGGYSQHPGNEISAEQIILSCFISGRRTTPGPEKKQDYIGCAVNIYFLEFK